MFCKSLYHSVFFLILKNQYLHSTDPQRTCQSIIQYSYLMIKYYINYDSVYSDLCIRLCCYWDDSGCPFSFLGTIQFALQSHSINSISMMIIESSIVFPSSILVYSFIALSHFSLYQEWCFCISLFYDWECSLFLSVYEIIHIIHHSESNKYRFSLRYELSEFHRIFLFSFLFVVISELSSSDSIEFILFSSISGLYVLYTLWYPDQSIFKSDCIDI